jgi:hypothetical protein
MSFERTVRHVNSVKEECKSYSNFKADSDVSVAPTSVQPPPAALPESVPATDAAAEAPMVQSAADIAENKKQEEIAAKSKAEMIKLMTNQRKLQRAKEKRESRIKEQLDSISVSDAEQRFAKVQQNKVANVRDIVSLRHSFFDFSDFVDACTLNYTAGSQHHAIWHPGARASCRKVRRYTIYIFIFQLRFVWFCHIGYLYRLTFENCVTCEQNCTRKDCQRPPPCQDAA